jgi:hypothetical protein
VRQFSPTFTSWLPKRATGPLFPEYNLLQRLGMRRFAVRVLRYWPIAEVGLGFLPALLLSSVLLDSITAADWSCSKVEFGASGSQYGGCSTIAGELIVAVAISWAVPLFVLVALLYLLRRTRRGEDDPEGRSSTAGGGEAVVGRVAIFVRAIAVLVGITNTLVIGDPRDLVGPSTDQPLAALLGAFLLAVAAGLVASEAVLRLGRTALCGGFFARYGITVLGMCLGGAMLGGSSLALGLLTNQPGTQGPGWSIAVLTYAALAYGLIAAVVGGALGVLEGLILGLPLAAILGKFQRRPAQARDISLPGVVIPGVLVVAATGIYAAAPPTEAERADLSYNPPLSCPEYLSEEIGLFEGPGDQTTPAFETTGTGWGYQYSSTGPGSLSIGVLDKNGDEMEDHNEPPADEFLAGNSVGSAEFAFSGTFRLEIAADDDVDYEVLVCD